MKKVRWKPYLFWIVLSELVGGLSALLTLDGMELYKTAIQKPPLSPPSIVFPIVWTILFALMGAGAARVYLSRASQKRSTALALFLVQLAVNFFWTIIFFRFQAYLPALLWLVLLWLLILWMTVAFHRLDAPAGWLQVPYLLWVAFAGYLNCGVWLLNR